MGDEIQCGLSKMRRDRRDAGTESVIYESKTAKEPFRKRLITS
jgi:hypothetical protein